jgi:hypothetical protein
LNSHSQLWRITGAAITGTLFGVFAVPWLHPSSDQGEPGQVMATSAIVRGEGGAIAEIGRAVRSFTTTDAPVLITLAPGESRKLLCGLYGRDGALLTSASIYASGSITDVLRFNPGKDDLPGRLQCRFEARD